MVSRVGETDQSQYCSQTVARIVVPEGTLAVAIDLVCFLKKTQDQLIHLTCSLHMHHVPTIGEQVDGH